MPAMITLGEHDQEAPRYRNVCKTFEKEGYSVLDCHAQKQTLLQTFHVLRKKFRTIRPQADTVLITFPGHYLVLLFWPLTRFPRKKIIFDAFVSLYDSMVLDRKRFSKWNPYAWFLYCIDWLSCHLADEVLIDTQAHKQFFVQAFHLKPEKIRVIYLGTREDLFCPNQEFQIPDSRFKILFYGTYIPLQGIQYIIHAAHLLQDHSDIHFTLVGNGQTYKDMRELAANLELTNIEFTDKVPYQELPDLIRNANLCLGIFGTSEKASRVIPHKVYDAIACGIPVLTADTPAIHEVLDSNPLMHLCAAGDAQSIANVILNIKNQES